MSAKISEVQISKELFHLFYITLYFWQLNDLQDKYSLQSHIRNVHKIYVIRNDSCNIHIYFKTLSDTILVCETA